MSEETFRKSLRSLIRGLWTSVIRQNQFEDEMSFLLEKEIANAWAEGASECGVKPDEYSDEEQAKLNEFIVNQVGYVSGLADAIVENNKKNGGDIFPLFDRSKLWLDRYTEAQANGHAMACSDQKAKFVFGKTKEHCGSCRGLVGRVYRYSTWAKYNAVPPHNWNFECRGGCQCGLVTTDEPITKGKFPIRLLQ